MTPLVSIGLPVYNSAQTLAATINSILNQTFQEWELLVMDDGSSDQTLNVLNRFDDSRIRIIADGIHRGLPEQLNRATALARGRYFARMDADDIAYPDRLRLQFEFLQEHPAVDLVAGWMVVFRGDGLAFGARRPPLAHSEICAHPSSSFPMAHPTWMGKIEWFRLHPYREGVRGVEDQDLLLRTYRSSHFANIPQMVLGYREERLSLRKILSARLAASAMKFRFAWNERSPLVGLGILGDVVKSALDVVACGTGLQYRLLRRRALPMRQDEVREWNFIWQHVLQSNKSGQPIALRDTVTAGSH